ncbi:MAG: FapA family protein [Treponema sp.]|jgi:uncharacterized protein (DUF342 family)|nr:FapA family protein [Treponema sp.]
MEKMETGPREHAGEQNERVLLLAGNRNDGNVSVLFLPGKLEARADFYPSMKDGKPLDSEYVVNALSRLNVVEVLTDNIKEAVNNCNHNRHIVRDVVIARGHPPVNEIAEYFQLNPNLHYEPGSDLKVNPRQAARTDGTDSVDFKAYSPFTIVKKGQALAKLKSRREGRDGVDIHGAPIPHSVVKPPSVSGGSNTRSDGVFIYSEINGQLIETDGVLAVSDSLVIKGAVDYRTGHIEFPGNVEIEGPVSDGFKIYSGGSVSIKQTFDVTDVITKTDLSVTGGIIGRGRALVKVGGVLRTKFIENCKVACRGDIFVDSGILNSSVYTMEKIEMGEKGAIIGGEIYSVKGIKTGSIGKKEGRATHIHCGVDFTAQQEKERCNNALRLIAGKLGKLKELMEAETAQENSEARLAKMTELQKRLENEQKTLSAALSGILVRINAFDEAVVEVLGEIAEGTLIEICQIALFVTTPLKHVRIHLDRAQGKLAADPL